jgi:hypothetical protein
MDSPKRRLLMLSKRIWGAALATVLGLLLLTACGDDDDNGAEEQQGAEAAVCNDLAALNTAAAQVESLTAASTVEDAQAARDAVRTAMNDLREDTANLAEVRLDQLDDAYGDLNSAIDDLPPDQSLGSAAESIKADAAGVVQSHANLRSQLGCP